MDNMLVDLVSRLVKRVLHLEHLMATVDEMKQHMAALSTAVDKVVADVADLKAKVATGGTVSQADLDSLDAMTQDMTARLDTALMP